MQHSDWLSFGFQIKLVDPATKTCTTFLGTGQSGHSTKSSPVQFDEPGGLCVSPDGQRLYVADTNNHAVVVVDLESKNTSQVSRQALTNGSTQSGITSKYSHALFNSSKLRVIEKHSDLQKDEGAEQPNKFKRLTSAKTPVIRREAARVNPASRVQLTLNVRLPDGCHLTEGATSQWQVFTVEMEKGNRTSQSKIDPDSVWSWSCCNFCTLQWPCYLFLNRKFRRNYSINTAMVFVIWRLIEANKPSSLYMYSLKPPHHTLRRSLLVAPSKSSRSSRCHYWILTPHIASHDCQRIYTAL